MWLLHLTNMLHGNNLINSSSCIKAKTFPPNFSWENRQHVGLQRKLAIDVRENVYAAFSFFIHALCFLLAECKMRCGPGD